MSKRITTPSSAQAAARFIALSACLASSAVSLGRPNERSLADRWTAENCEHCLQAKLAAMEGLPGPDADPRAAAFDSATGRSKLHYPPHRYVDFQHLKIDLVIPDMNTPRCAASATLTIEPISTPVEALTLDAELMKITGVSLNGQPIKSEHDGSHLVVHFQPPLERGRSSDLLISYTLDNPPEGLIWTPESPSWPGRPAQLHTQGQPESNRYWFPFHDFPNVRTTTEIIAVVPEGFQVISNGRLLGTEPRTVHTDSGDRTLVAHHWLQNKPHVGYLVSLVVGKFDVVDVSTTSLPMPVYVPPGMGGMVRQSYGRTPRMIALFEKLTGRAYPWDKYSQTLVWNFGSGGMENTSATTLYDTAVLDSTALLDGDLDGLIAHELAHQWFGDLLTCNSWEHLWLNEGFATYFDALWQENRDGADRYQSQMWGAMQGLIAGDKAAAPNQPGMVSKVYGHPWENFGRAANPYSKGSFILHMLRMRLGDEVFFRAIRAYVATYQGRTVETHDFRRTLEQVSGDSLQRFFNQWAVRPGVPNVRLQTTWDSAAGELIVQADQTQPIDGANPAFDLNIPIWVQLPGQTEWTRLALPFDTRHAEARFPLPAQPALLCVDPELTMLANIDLPISGEQAISLFKSGPTFASRRRALPAVEAACGSSDASLSRSAVEALDSLIRSDAFDGLRVEAASALGSAGRTDDLLQLLSEPLKPSRVQIAVIDAIAQAAAGKPVAPQLGPALATLADKNPSYAVRSAAVRSIARLKLTDQLPAVLAAVDQPSQNDQIRQAALDALADMDRPEGLSLAIAAAQTGTLSRTRPTAINTIVRLAHHDPDLATRTLARLLNDPELRTFRAAGEGLVKIGGPAARSALQEASTKARGRVQQESIEGWLKSTSG